jgi:hypothetical protein
VDLHEHSVYTCSHGRARQNWDEFRLASTDGLTVVVSRRGRGQLHGMSGVENHGRELTHDGERAHVDHQVVVAETGAALGDEDPLVAGGVAFFDRVPHVPGRHELAFLDIDDALS